MVNCQPVRAAKTTDMEQVQQIPYELRRTYAYNNHHRLVRGTVYIYLSNFLKLLHICTIHWIIIAKYYNLSVFKLLN